MANTQDLVLGYRQDELNGIEVEAHPQTGRVFTSAQTEIENAFIENERTILTLLNDSGYTPRVYPDGTQEYVPDEAVTDEIRFYRNCINMLLTLKENNVRHGDLTTPNILVRNNSPIVIDFHQSHIMKAGRWNGFPKRPERDAYHLWNACIQKTGDTTRRMRRWLEIYEHLGNRHEPIRDFGCADGDFGGLASAEGINYVGYDSNQSAIQRAIKLWDYKYCHFEHANLTEMKLDYGKGVALFLSVHAHIEKKYGASIADKITKSIIRGNEAVFIEIHLHGDGPGSERFQNDRDVYDYLKSFGRSIYVKWLCQLPVHGRDRARSLWRLEYHG